MKHARIIIGAGLGDEGKGKLTDYYSRNDCDLVVRFNGGAQAAHTVVQASGAKHVFGHLGSGSLNGVPTYLSEHFIVNPAIFNKEIDIFHRSFDGYPSTWLDEGCPVTTIYDMALNIIAETARGSYKHGSCGVGINETIHRTQQPELCLRVIDLDDFDKVKEICTRIRDEWVPFRLKELDITEYDPNWDRIIKGDGAIETFYELIKVMRKTTGRTNLSILGEADHVVFEGAQGLLLDEEHEWFPNVTRSKTGLHNALDLIQRAGGTHTTQATYVTRPYLTRHGAGPLPLEDCVYNDISDPTNIPNDFQGKLRIGLLDIDLLARTIKDDIISSTKKFPMNVYSELAVTCLDHCIEYTDGEVVCSVDGDVKQFDEEDFIYALFDKVGIKKAQLSYSEVTPTSMLQMGT